MLLIDAPLDSQPQEAVEVDWGNPIAQGLVTAFHGAPSAIGGAFRTASSAQVGAILGGSGLTGFDGSSAYAILDGAPRINGGAFSVLTGVFYEGQASPYTIIAQGGAGAGQGWRLGTLPSGIGGVGNRFQITYGSVANYSNSAGTMVSGAVNVVGFTATGDGGTATYYLNGSIDSAFTIGTMALPASTDTVIGSAHNNSTFVELLPSGMGVQFALIWNRALTDDEIRSVSANPWQLFRAPVEAWIPTATPITLSPIATLDNTNWTPSSGTVHGALAAVGGPRITSATSGASTHVRLG